jgi:molybdate transport system substrate-binding protein
MRLLGRRLWGIMFVSHSMKKMNIAFVLALICLSVNGCREEDSLQISIACDPALKEIIEELADGFEQEHGVVIEPRSYAGSEVLLSQMSESQDLDLVIAGDLHYLDEATARGHVEQSSFICRLRPAILVHEGNPFGVDSLNSLVQEGLRVGLCDPLASALGRRSKHMLLKQGIAYDELTDNFVLYRPTSRELVEDVVSGELDAAIIWDCVSARVEEECEVVEIPESEVLPSVAVIMLTNFSDSPDYAKQFMEYCGSSEGEAIIEEYGYTPEAKAHELSTGDYGESL